ncbi:MAG: hypothetical protein JW904_08515 [Spirochaetales bacterium]|nr:hypothetical protein [Spirochaetales bacterium]
MKICISGCGISFCLIAVLCISCAPPGVPGGVGTGEPGVITFVSEGAVFSPIIVLSSDAEVLWTFADGATSSLTHPEKNYGSAESRSNTLSVTPWSALRRINLGYDAGDGGTYSIEFNDDQHVSTVSNLQVAAPYLVEWCSSYNDFTSLNFHDFVNLETIECFLSTNLQSVDLSNTPSLRRACFEDCNLGALDLSDCTALEDLRGALNNYTTINFGTVGADVWHICIRENHSLANATMFADMTQFPQIAELYIWDDHQSGELSIPSSSSTRNVEILGWSNNYTSLDLEGALGNQLATGTIDLRYNHLAQVNITGCIQINNLNLAYNQLDEADIDQILADLDALGRSELNVPNSAPLVVDLRGNVASSAAGYASAENLAGKGWTVYTAGYELTPPPPENTGAATVSFSTTGDTTTMLVGFDGSPDAVWHWSDGTTSAAVSGQSVVKSGLGPGTHSHSLEVSNGAALTRFGAASGGGLGNLVTISGLEACSYLEIVYAYNESALVSIGDTGTTRIREYHLMGSAISAAEMDGIFADAVATTVVNGTIWAPNAGTSGSDADRATLAARGWSLSY